jgi:GTP-binding protein
LVIADLPGIIEGAHQNKGLGHKFLKHVERTKVIIFVLDGSLNPQDERSPMNDLNSLLKEIVLYNKDYSNKPFIIALNKIDLNSENFNINYELLKKNFKQDIITISGKDGIGLDKLTIKIKQYADQYLTDQKTL